MLKSEITAFTVENKEVSDYKKKLIETFNHFIVAEIKNQNDVLRYAP